MNTLLKTVAKCVSWRIYVCCPTPCCDGGMLSKVHQQDETFMRGIQEQV